MDTKLYLFGELGLKLTQLFKKIIFFRKWWVKNGLCGQMVCEDTGHGSVDFIGIKRSVFFTDLPVKPSKVY